MMRRVRQRIAQVKEELRLLRLKQRLMKPFGVRRQMQLDRSNQAWHEQGDTGNPTQEGAGTDHDPHTGQRIGEAANPGPPLGDTAAHSSRACVRRQLAPGRKLEQGHADAQTPLEVRRDDRREGLGWSLRTGRGWLKRGALRLIRIVSGILLLVQALSVFDPTSTKGDGPGNQWAHTPKGSMCQAPKDRPTVQVASANITSLQGVWDLITELPFDVLAMQEMHITDLPYWQRRASQADMQLVVPPAAPGSERLVGFLVRKGTLCTIPLVVPLANNRVHLAAWHFDEGPPVLIANIYGHVTPTGQQQEELGQTLAAFLEHCEAGGALLAVLTGDMNMTRQENPASLLAGPVQME